MRWSGVHGGINPDHVSRRIHALHACHPCARHVNGREDGIDCLDGVARGFGLRICQWNTEKEQEDGKRLLAKGCREKCHSAPSIARSSLRPAQQNLEQPGKYDLASRRRSSGKRLPPPSSAKQEGRGSRATPAVRCKNPSTLIADSRLRQCGTVGTPIPGLQCPYLHS